jgi:hypothetical protein
LIYGFGFHDFGLYDFGLSAYGLLHEAGRLKEIQNLLAGVGRFEILYVKAIKSKLSGNELDYTNP